jgi:hypothetical protein
MEDSSSSFVEPRGNGMRFLWRGFMGGIMICFPGIGGAELNTTSSWMLSPSILMILVIFWPRSSRGKA